MFHANIEAGIEHVCNIRNRNFQKFPLAFRARQFVDDTLYCRQFDMYNVETIVTYYQRGYILLRGDRSYCFHSNYYLVAPPSDQRYSVPIQ